eukprot:350396-Chlamydomonas_euryale.AAC.7
MPTRPFRCGDPFTWRKCSVERGPLCRHPDADPDALTLRVQTSRRILCGKCWPGCDVRPLRLAGHHLQSRAAGAGRAAAHAGVGGLVVKFWEPSQSSNSGKLLELASFGKLLEPANSGKLLEPASSVNLLEPAYSGKLVEPANAKNLLEPAYSGKLVGPANAGNPLEPNQWVPRACSRSYTTQPSHQDTSLFHELPSIRSSTSCPAPTVPPAALRNKAVLVGRLDERQQWAFEAMRAKDKCGEQQQPPFPSPPPPTHSGHTFPHSATTLRCHGRSAWTAFGTSRGVTRCSRCALPVWATPSPTPVHGRPMGTTSSM